MKTEQNRTRYPFDHHQEATNMRHVVRRNGKPRTKYDEEHIEAAQRKRDRRAQFTRGYE
jgi:hypothetical protein